MASRRGYAPTLKIPISEPKHFPNRFIGTWTRVFADPFARPGVDGDHSRNGDVRPERPDR